MSQAVETTDVLVVGTGPGGAIPGYHLAAAGAKVVFLERGPWLRNRDFTHNLQIGTYTRIVDYITGSGVNVVAGNCVGGSSVVYFAAALRSPSYVFERRGLTGTRLWPRSMTRHSLDPWYDRVEAALPVERQTWNDVPYPGGVFAALCHRAGHTCNPVPLAVDLKRCTNCNWMLNGCRFDAKRSMLLNYLPGALAHHAQIRPLHEVQAIAPATTPGYRYRVTYSVLDGGDYRRVVDGGAIEAKIVVLAAGAMGTPVILQRSAAYLGSMPSAVGRYFSPNGDRVTMAALDERKIRSVLGLEREPGVAYEAFAIGKPIGSMSYDYLDGRRAEFSRFGLQQIYFPTITNILAEDGVAGSPVWFGRDKRALSRRWRSWLTLLAMTEDGNEGVFGSPPPNGNFIRLASSASIGQLSYTPSKQTLRGWRQSDAAMRRIVERDRVGKHLLWSGSPNALSAHPLASCRIGDDPNLSACDDRHELRGHPGIFVTDGAAVPTSLTVNPSLTIAALAERAADALVRRAAVYGLSLRHPRTQPLEGSASLLTAG
jgi:choline dehydrogenase-like flavoprotein